jgi:hypothetical protein
MSTDLKKELKLLLKEKKLQRTSKQGRDFIEKKLKTSTKDDPNTGRLLKVIEEQNDKEYGADGGEGFYGDD